MTDRGESRRGDGRERRAARSPRTQRRGGRPRPRRARAADRRRRPVDGRPADRRHPQRHGPRLRGARALRPAAQRRQPAALVLARRGARRARRARARLPAPGARAVRRAPAARACRSTCRRRCCSKPRTMAMLDAAGAACPDELARPDHRDHRGDARARRHAAARARSSRCAPAARALAVDDMGAGYSGLRQITTVLPSYLKLDRSLVTGIDARRRARRARRRAGRLLRAGRLPAGRRGHRDRRGAARAPPPRRAARPGLLPQPPRSAVAAGQRAARPRGRVATGPGGAGHTAGGTAARRLATRSRPRRLARRASAVHARAATGAVRWLSR